MYNNSILFIRYSAIELAQPYATIIDAILDIEIVQMCPDDLTMLSKATQIPKPP